MRVDLERWICQNITFMLTLIDFICLINKNRVNLQEKLTYKKTLEIVEIYPGYIKD